MLLPTFDGLITAITTMMTDTGLLPIAFVGAIIGGATLLLRRAIKAAR